MSCEQIHNINSFNTGSNWMLLFCCTPYIAMDTYMDQHTTLYLRNKTSLICPTLHTSVLHSRVQYMQIKKLAAVQVIYKQLLHYQTSSENYRVGSSLIIIWIDLLASNHADQFNYLQLLSLFVHLNLVKTCSFVIFQQSAQAFQSHLKTALLINGSSIIQHLTLDYCAIHCILVCLLCNSD